MVSTVKAFGNYDSLIIMLVFMVLPKCASFQGAKTGIADQ